MSEASNRNFGLEQRHRERRMNYNLLNPGVSGNLPDPAMDSLWGSIYENGPISFGSLSQSRGPSLAGRDTEVARSFALNTALSDMQDDRRETEQRQRSLKADADMREAAARQARQPADDVAAIDRAFALSRSGAGVMPGRIEQTTPGTYQSRGDGPIADPRDVMRENLPGHLQPAPPPAVTFKAPVAMMVGDQRMFVREGSDGQMYDMSRKPIDPSKITPPDEPVGALETVTGPDGKPIRVRAKDAIGKEPAAGTMKASTGVQKRVLNFFNRAEQADTELEGMEADIQQLGLVSQGRLKFAPNFAQSQLGQSYGAAQRAFTEARLRKDSGAAIPEEEFENDQRTYFAQPGDSKETLEQKRRARAAILSSLAFESGQALGEFVGDADEAKSILQRYKDRASGKPSGASGNNKDADASAWLKARNMPDVPENRAAWIARNKK